MASHTTSTPIERLTHFYDPVKDTNVTITCGNRQWKTHRFYLSVHSEVFGLMLIREHDQAKECEIQLLEDDPSPMDPLLSYMYTFDYKPDLLRSDIPLLMLHMRVAKTAKKYKMPELESDAINAFKNDCPFMWCLPGFADAIMEAYGGSGYDDFKAVLLESAVFHLVEFKSDTAKFKFFWDVVRMCGEFAVALLQMPSLEGQMRDP